jgi:hypothetical protein
MEPRQDNPNCTAERQQVQVPELASASKPKRRFRIDRLEERIAPGKISCQCGTPIYKNGDHGPIIGCNC